MFGQQSRDGDVAFPFAQLRVLVNDNKPSVFQPRHYVPVADPGEGRRGGLHASGCGKRIAPLRLSSHSRFSQAPSFGEGTQHLPCGNPPLPLPVAKRAASAPNREPALSGRLQTRAGFVSTTS